MDNYYEAVFFFLATPRQKKTPNKNKNHPTQPKTTPNKHTKKTRLVGNLE